MSEQTTSRPAKPGTANREANDCYYTKTETVRMIVARMAEAKFMRGVDLFVDTSCGDNRAVATIRQTFRSLRTRSFDIDPSGDCGDAETRDWLDVRPGELQGRVCIGFNPPFGTASGQIRAFLKHALEVADVVKIGIVCPTADVAYVIPEKYDCVSMKLPAASFETRAGASYHYPCSFVMATRTWPAPVPCSFRRRPPPEAGLVAWARFSRAGPVLSKHSLVVRRVGVNFLRQAYVLQGGGFVAFVERGERVKGLATFRHSVDGDAFFKIEITDPAVNVLETAEALTRAPRREEDEAKQPPSISQRDMNHALARCVVRFQSI